MTENSKSNETLPSQNSSPVIKNNLEEFPALPEKKNDSPSHSSSSSSTSKNGGKRSGSNSPSSRLSHDSTKSSLGSISPKKNESQDYTDSSSSSTIMTTPDEKKSHQSFPSASGSEGNSSSSFNNAGKPILPPIKMNWADTTKNGKSSSSKRGDDSSSSSSSEENGHTSPNEKDLEDEDDGNIYNDDEGEEYPFSSSFQDDDDEESFSASEISRAENGKNLANPFVQKERTLHLSNLPKRIQPIDVQMLLMFFLDPEKYKGNPCPVPIRILANDSRYKHAYAFVVLPSEEDVRIAIEKINQKSWSRKQKDIPKSWGSRYQFSFQDSVNFSTILIASRSTTTFETDNEEFLKKYALYKSNDDGKKSKNTSNQTKTSSSSSSSSSSGFVEKTKSYSDAAHGTKKSLPSPVLNSSQPDYSINDSDENENENAPKTTKLIPKKKSSSSSKKTSLSTPSLSSSSGVSTATRNISQALEPYKKNNQNESYYSSGSTSSTSSSSSSLGSSQQSYNTHHFSMQHGTMIVPMNNGNNPSHVGQDSSSSPPVNTVMFQGYKIQYHIIIVECKKLNNASSYTYYPSTNVTAFSSSHTGIPYYPSVSSIYQDVLVTEKGRFSFESEKEFLGKLNIPTMAAFYGAVFYNDILNNLMKNGTLFDPENGNEIIYHISFSQSVCNTEGIPVPLPSSSFQNYISKKTAMSLKLI